MATDIEICFDCRVRPKKLSVKSGLETKYTFGCKSCGYFPALNHTVMGALVSWNRTNGEGLTEHSIKLRRARQSEINRGEHKINVIAEEDT